MNTAHEFDIDALEREARGWIGTRDERLLGTMRRLDFQRFALTVGDTDPLYFDEDFARRHGHPALVVPPMYLSSVMGWGAGPALEDLREDGLAEDDLLPVRMPGLRVMGAGQEVEFARVVYEGTHVTMRREFTGVERREGRSGPLLFFTVQREYVDAQAPAAQALLVRVEERFIAR